MTVPHLLPADALERTSVVANNTMNRERGLTGVNSYARELGLDPVARLLARGSAAPAWLDLCSGEGRALREALPRLPAGAVLTGVDLVGPPAGLPVPAGLELVTAPAGCRSGTSARIRPPAPTTRVSPPSAPTTNPFR
ncbi:hypothetical protein [Streptomyces sp. NBC_00347]|uniref:hypothetical protein n=1 Tax=Streptomyces sp. NBC_00347 TaxID=2975721 RepID=UPI00224CEA00|nr:hypothetical protein [Streptomyces sp. NBC_00347]MCX5128128.1 hypothetical protein [Streptomyces sp. NBC_00347]